MTAGIYIIRNYVNSKVYIGSTVNINERWNRHTSLTQSTCYRLRNAMRKHGVDQFFWEWLEPIEITNLTKQGVRSLLLTREQCFLDALQPFNNVGYNIARKAGSNLGITFNRRTPKPYTHTPEYMKKVSGQNSKNNKPVVKYDAMGNFLCEYFNVKTAVIANPGTTIQAIIKCCKLTQKTAGGHLWSYCGCSPVLPTPHKSRPVNMYTISGIFVRTYDNAKYAAVDLQKSVNPIYKCCRNEQPSAHGAIWKFD